MKGIMRADDAEEAIARGVHGIIVSNHGGRQLDSAPATIDVLPSIVQAVNGRVPAIALGASGVFVGRPVIWGLTVGVS
ncbi:unnamed protein product [Strongylus vulgaris]|uniref:FMN hydroxy acid dehydrogenase domain-containing protein n=1 Tax=Strongylus vulgaris TaxID=40348 RepID=A0A3P7JA35_STRVU|nr:unnamed protein product [Strongylus vulgaris]